MFPTIDLRPLSTDHARGLAHGRAAHARDALSVGTYARMCAGCGIGWAEACDRALAYADVIAALSPRWLAEIRGIAEGSGQPLSAILALNCRTEILPPGLYAEQPDEARVRAALKGNAAAGLSDWADGSGRCRKANAPPYVWRRPPAPMATPGWPRTGTGWAASARRWCCSR